MTTLAAPEDTKSRPDSLPVSDTSTTPSVPSSFEKPAIEEEEAGRASRRAQPPPSQPPPRDIGGVRWVTVVVAILSSAFLFALDNTVVADVQPQIVRQFNAVADLAWLSVVFIMAAVATNLWWGQLYGVLPPKWLYIASVALFEAGSAVCGAAPTMDALIIGRAVCGFGGIGMYLGVISLLAATTTAQERPLYLGCTGLTWGLGTILGPVVGGAFADSSATWRWAFYINLVIGAVAAPVYLFLLPNPDPLPATRLRTRLSRVDWLGTVLLVGALVSFVMAVNFGGVLYAWSSAREIALFVVAGVLFILFGLQQAFSVGVAAAHRVFPVEMVAGPAARTCVLVFGCTAAGGAGIFLPVYFIPLFFQFTRGDGATAAAVRLLPFIAVLVTVTLAQGALLPRGAFGYYAAWYLAGGLLTVAGGALMYALGAGVDSTDAEAYGFSALVGLGVGMYTQSGFSVAQASVAEDRQSTASAFVSLGQTGGVTITLAVANSVFLNTAEDKLARLLPGVPKEQIQAAVAGGGSDLQARLSPELKRQVLEVVVDAMRKPYILLITAGAVTTVLSLLMKRERLLMKMAAPAA